MSTTIRKNAYQKIWNILSRCVLIRRFKYDDMGDDMATVSADDVIAAGREYEFDRVAETDDQIRCSIHRNFAFTGYKSIEGARRTMTPIAFRNCFPWVDADGFIPADAIEDAAENFAVGIEIFDGGHSFATNAEQICACLGHVINDDSSAGPESGDMDHFCGVCGEYWAVPLY